MKRFRRILLVPRAPSPSDALTRRVASFAERNEAEIILTGVVDTSGIDEEAAREFESHLSESKRLQVEFFANEIEDRGVHVGVRVLAGVEFIEIIRLVLREHIDLVLVQASEEVRGSRWHSTTMHLLRKCPCPVWVLHPDQRAEHRRVVAAVERPLPYMSESRKTLNKTIMELASSLARLESCELHVVHGWSLGVDRWPGRPGGMTEERKQRLRRSIERDVRGFAELFASPDLDLRVHIEEGKAARIITEFAKQLDADLIVMGTVGHTGIRGLLIGSTAEDVLSSETHCSVLTVKPSGFQTPVTLEGE